MSFQNINFSDYPTPDPNSSFYFASDGRDDGNGTKDKPFKTIAQCYSALTNYRNSIGNASAYGYIIAKPGVYTRDNRGIEFIGAVALRGSFMFNVMNMKNVTIMSEVPLAAKLDLFSTLEKTGTNNTGLINETAILRPLEFGQTYTASNGSVAHFFYGLSADAKNVRPELVFTTAAIGELPRLTDERIPYPAIYGYSATENISNWKSNFENWSLFRNDENKYNLGLTYEFENVNGVTNQYIRARQDLVAANESNIPGFTFIDMFWNKIIEIENNHEGICWSDCSICYQGGPNITETSYIINADHDNRRLQVKNVPGWFKDERLYNVNGQIINTKTGQPTSAVGFIGKLFAEKPYMYSYEPNSGNINYKFPPDNNTVPRVASGTTVPNNAFHIVGSTNITIAGFHICGFDMSFMIILPYANNNSINKDIYYKYNVLCDSNINMPGIEMRDVLGDFDAIGNLVIRANSRGIQYLRGSTFTTSNRDFTSVRSQINTAKIRKNMCYDWRQRTGIYTQQADKADISENVTMVASTSHGNGMAFYVNSRDIKVRNNFVYTPGVIGIAVAEIHPESEPFLFEGNFLQSFSNRVTGNPVGITFNNNVIISYEAASVVKLKDNSLGLWWDASKTTFRNNVMMRMTKLLDYTGAEMTDGTFNVYTTGMPPEFSQVAANLGSTLGRAYLYWSHSWKQLGNTLPNAYKNITPGRYGFDNYQHPTIFYPYEETETTIVDYTFQVPPYQVSIPDQGRIDLISDSMFIDWRNGDFRLNNQYNSSAGVTIGISIRPGITFDYAARLGLTDLDDKIDKWWTPSESSGLLIINDSTEGEGETTPPPTTPTPISNHPITISLTTTDIDKDISWNTKNSFFGITHGPDSFYSASSLVQIPNYLERIEDITDPNDHPSIGPSRSNEISGNISTIGNQGGVYVTGGTIDVTLNPVENVMNSIDVKNIATKFQTSVRTAGGNTFAVILHGKTIPSTAFGEFKYLAAQSMTREEWDENGRPDDIDPETIPYENFYKKFAYISFHSKEALVNQSITSNQFSFRKSPHHTYINFSRPEMDGLSLSNVLNGTSIIDMVTPIVDSKLTKIQTAAIGCTCNFNSYETESTSATRVNGTSPNVITCKSISLEYLGFDGNQIRFKNKTSGSMFSNRTPAYQHNGAIGSANQTFQFNSSVNDYRFDQPVNEPDVPPTPEQSINIRFVNPVGSGSKNLLAYKVPVGGTRLFGASPNIGITAGSYVRISGSASNNGIYQVLSVADGIEGDTASNTKTNGSTEYQYLELSRSITAQEQAVGNNITIQNVSHLPILHIKYRTPV